MIINLRGTSGSGKSTVARRIIQEFGGEPIMGYVPTGEFADDGSPIMSKKERIVGYEIGNLWIPGSYVNTCGGCDTFSWKGAANYLEEKTRLVAANGYHALIEGLVQTAGDNRWMGISDDHPGQYVWAYLDTPVEKCIERVLARNGGREGKRNWENLRASYDHAVGQRAKLERLGYPIVIINHEQAFEQVTQILREAGWNR